MPPTNRASPSPQRTAETVSANLTSPIRNESEILSQNSAFSHASNQRTAIANEFTGRYLQNFRRHTAASATDPVTPTTPIRARPPPRQSMITSPLSNESSDNNAKKSALESNNAINEGNRTNEMNRVRSQSDSSEPLPPPPSRNSLMRSRSDGDNSTSNVRATITRSRSIDLSRWTQGEPATSTPEILSRLYNYMKISEMDKYGIPVFEKILEAYLPVLEECDIEKLVTSYWCNGIHFQCLIKYRCVLIKNGELRLGINDSLLDAAITGGSSVEKISAMLVQRRMDLGNPRLSSKKEQDFFKRNCQYRFWNHEVLVKSFLQNGWLNQQLSQLAMDRFINYIYKRAMETDSQLRKNKNGHFWILDPEISAPHACAHPNNNNTTEVIIDEMASNVSFANAVASKLVSTNGCQCMNDNQLIEDADGMAVDRLVGSTQRIKLPVSLKTIQRWQTLIGILASRGAKCSPKQFCLATLQNAANTGMNTWQFLSSSISRKNELLMDACELTIPTELWDLVSSHL